MFYATWAPLPGDPSHFSVFAKKPEWFPRPLTGSLRISKASSFLVIVLLNLSMAFDPCDHPAYLTLSHFSAAFVGVVFPFPFRGVFGLHVTFPGRAYPRP